MNVTRFTCATVVAIAISLTVTSAIAQETPKPQAPVPDQPPAPPPPAEPPADDSARP